MAHEEKSVPRRRTNTPSLHKVANTPPGLPESRVVLAKKNNKRAQGGHRHDSKHQRHEGSERIWASPALRSWAQGKESDPVLGKHSGLSEVTRH